MNFASRLPRLVLICLLAVRLNAAEGRQHSAPEAQQVRDLIERGLYDQAEATARVHLRSATLAQGVDSIDASAAADLVVRASVLNGKAATEPTRALAESTLRRKRATLGIAHPELVPSLLNLADVLVASGDYALAIDAARQAVATCEEHDVAAALLPEALRRLGAALDGAGRTDEALVAYNRSLATQEATLPPTSVEIARTLELIGYSLQRKGLYQEAGKAIRRALALQEAADRNHPAYANTLNLLSLQVWFEGDLQGSHDAARRAVEVAELTLRSDHPTLARGLRYQAGALMDLGALFEARVLLERALAVAERTFGVGHYDTWAYLNDFALTDLYMGSYSSARTLFERALKVAEAKVGAWHDRVATTVHNLGLVQAHIGDYAGAEQQYVRAIAIWERVSGRSHPYVARALMHLATVHREAGTPRKALPLLERALRIREQRLGVDHRDVAATLAELAATLQELGELARAKSIVTRALQIWEQAGTPEEGPGFATIPLVFAAVHRDLGEVNVARRSYERALAIQEKVVGRSHPQFAETQAEFAALLATAGELQSAVAQVVEADATGRDHVRLMLRYLPERQSLAYAAKRTGVLDLLLSLMPSMSDTPVHVVDSVIRSRALVTDEMAARRAHGPVGDVETMQLRSRLVTAQQRSANLLVRGPGLLGPAAYAAAVAEARREAENIERQLAERNAAFRDELRVAHIGLEEVRASLTSGTALVSFVRYQRTVDEKAPPAPSLTRPRHPVTSYLAFVLAAGRPIAAIPLGEAAAIDLLITRWRQEIVADVGRPAAKPTASQSRVSGSALRKLIWDPIASHLSGATQVLIVADGSLHLVPFAALPVGGDAYLLEEAPTIHYLSAERDLVERSRPADRSKRASGLLALGAPAFDGVISPDQGDRAPSVRLPALPPTRGFVPGCGNFQNVRFDHLNGALQEARDIAALWQTQGSEQLKGSARLLTGAEASERAFKRYAPGHRVLHLATHGFFLGPDCTLSTRSQRGIGGLATTSGRKPAALRENPLHLSGLALAGANRRASAAPQGEDGVLTAEEVVSLNLDGVEWAVLSACDTGVGVVHAGEGVFGLRRAFQVAGVRTVIMSLWSVDDQAARAWMQALYAGRLRDNLSTADAARAASLEVLHDRRNRGLSTHPFYWAAFVAVGDSR
jgi:CHAT domain-containing protein/tetratricopeptide (TPR) repeat protein